MLKDDRCLGAAAILRGFKCSTFETVMLTSMFSYFILRLLSQNDILVNL